jgi:ubiquinone/menaquinone biosynthesis C-methylase UbiE
MNGSGSASGRDALSLALDVAALEGGERVLDLSERGGVVAIAAADSVAASVEALQPSEEDAEEAARLARSMGHQSVFFHVGRRDRLPFDPGQADVVMLCGGLSREPLPVAALREVRRVLAPGGRLVLQEVLAFGDPALDLRLWEAERRRERSHLMFYSLEELATLMDVAGLAVEHEEHTVMTQDLRQWAGGEGDPTLVAEARETFFSLAPHLQDRLDLALADGLVLFSYPLVTLRAIPS